MIRVAQIIPYFGKWPEWMDLYLYSCERNKMIDFIFYTDCAIPADHGDNIRFHSISYEDYKVYAGRKLGITYDPASPYKLTDLKPFLGLIHEDELRDYDWWGFGDLDLVYGDMSMIVNPRSLSRYDVLTTHNYHIAGHCTFVRNTERFRTLCLEIRDWENRLNSSTHYGFDEAEWSDLVYPAIRYPLGFHRHIIAPIGGDKFFNRFMDRANGILNPRQLFKEFHTSPAPGSGKEWIYDVRNSKVFDKNGLELPYLHFLFFKKTPWLETDIYWRDGFYGLREDISFYHRIRIDHTGIKPY